MNYRFLSPALKELTKAAEYYEEQVPGLGEDFLVEVDATIQRILQFPQAWNILKDGIRHCNLRRFPYTILYKPNQQEVIVISVFHLKQDPGKWEDNL